MQAQLIVLLLALVALVRFTINLLRLDGTT